MKFEDLSLSEEIKKSLKEINYITMTPIQEKTFDKIIQGRNIVAASNTGTGKTLAFLVPLIEKIDIDVNSTQILILVPTRELAIQIGNEIKKLIKYKNNIDYVSIVGGKEIKEQAALLRKNKKKQQVPVNAGREVNSGKSAVHFCGLWKRKGRWTDGKNNPCAFARWFGNGDGDFCHRYRHPD